jgi:glycosyltransferase involved in cell wall biosynthesis
MRPSPFVIGYYSGTRTHRADFALVAPALARFMLETPDVIFRLVGELDLDDYPGLRPFQDIRRRGDPPRVIRVGLMHHDAMMRDQLSCDLIIAPLEPGNPFCEGKSELKFFEASLASCPVIASSTATFAEATRDGKFADLAETSDDWLQAFRRSYSDYDGALSRARGAFHHVRRFYSRTFAAGEALRAYEDHLAGYEGCLAAASAVPLSSTLPSDRVEAVVNRAVRP